MRLKSLRAKRSIDLMLGVSGHDRKYLPNRKCRASSGLADMKQRNATHHSERCDCGYRSAMTHVSVIRVPHYSTVSSNPTAFILYRAAL
jgi:hypothetical protein